MYPQHEYSDNWGTSGKPTIWKAKHRQGLLGLRYNTVVRAFAHGAMGRRIDPSCGGPIELFLVPASAPRLV